MLDPAVVKASYYCDAIMTPCLCKVVMFSQITRCTVDFWHDTSFSHFPFLQHLHSLTIAAGAHFPTKWFTFCHFTRVQLAEAEKNAQYKAARLKLLLSSLTGPNESLEVLSWVPKQEATFSFLSTQMFFSSYIQRSGVWEISWNTLHCFLPSDFSVDLWNDTESKHGTWEAMWSLWSKQGAGFYSWLCYRLTLSPTPTLFFHALVFIVNTWG